MQYEFLKSKLLVQFVSIFDVFFALFVVTPLVVAFWSTTFTLYDMFLLPNKPVVSGAVSWAFGFCGQMALMFYQDLLKRILFFEKHKFVNILLLKVYALFLAHTFANYWRGVWCFVDATFVADVNAVCFNIFQNVAILIILRSFTNILTPPFMISIDKSGEEQYSMTTLLQKKKANGSFMFFIDCLATMFVETLVAFIWHDLWFILDNSDIFRDDIFYSALASLVFGYLLALICFTLRPISDMFYDKFVNQKLLIFYIFAITAFVSSLNIWRGLWLFVSYFTGNDPQWILLLNILASILLMIGNCSLSLSAKDIAKDAESPDKFCVFYTQYLSEMLFQETDIKSDNTHTITTRL